MNPVHNVVAQPLQKAVKERATLPSVSELLQEDAASQSPGALTVNARPQPVRPISAYRLQQSPEIPTLSSLSLMNEQILPALAQNNVISPVVQTPSPFFPNLCTQVAPFAQLASQRQLVQCQPTLINSSVSATSGAINFAPPLPLLQSSTVQNACSPAFNKSTLALPINPYHKQSTLTPADQWEMKQSVLLRSTVFNIFLNKQSGAIYLPVRAIQHYSKLRNNKV